MWIFLLPWQKADSVRDGFLCVFIFYLLASTQVCCAVKHKLAHSFRLHLVLCLTSDTSHRALWRPRPRPGPGPGPWKHPTARCLVFCLPTFWRSADRGVCAPPLLGSPELCVTALWLFPPLPYEKRCALRCRKRTNPLCLPGADRSRPWLRPSCTALLGRGGRGGGRTINH